MSLQTATETVSSLYWIRRFHEVASAFAAAGLRALPLKGASLMIDTLPPEAGRPQSDLDIFISEDEFGACSRALEDAGFRRSTPLVRGVLANHGQECLFRAADGAEVDVHYRLFIGYVERHVLKIDSREFFRRAVDSEWKGIPIRRLRKEDEFVYALLSARTSPRYLRDAEAVARVHGSVIDWDYVARFLSRPAVERALARGARGGLRGASAGEAAGFVDRAALALLFAKWQAFKLAGLFRRTFVALNNPGGRELADVR